MSGLPYYTHSQPSLAGTSSDTGEKRRGKRARLDRTFAGVDTATLETIHNVIVNAICDQPAHTDDKFNAPLAYELSVLNWDVVCAIQGKPILIDEWWYQSNV